MRSHLTVVFVCCVLVASAHPASVPLKVDTPAGAGGIAVPVAGGIPFAKGQLASVDNVRLLDAAKKEIPCQVMRTAVWPDGSIKWALIDAVLTPTAGQSLPLEFGPDVHRAAVANGVVAALNGPDAKVSGGGVTATIHKSGGGVIDELNLNGKGIIAAGQPARLVIEALRASGPDAFPVNHYVCRDAAATLDTGKVQIDELAIESPGPIRATVLLRGHVLLPHFGETLPDEVKRVEPSGKLPFSLRLSFYKDCGVVYGQHQIVFSGEPDRDFIARWGIELPGLAGARGTLVLEPGVELDQAGDKVTVAKQDRLCWAPLKNSLALIREGWQNRPCAITQEKTAAFIDFWPRAAGVWDLRRYAREWSVGESGDTKDVASMERFAKYAARGMAKSHNFVLWFGDGAPDAAATALSARALLLAPPSWYAATQALGPFVPEQTAGDAGAIDAETHRKIDYHLYCQDLFGWYGKTTYGYWQSRFGQVHRNDRWDNDYGRWGWALNDGGGRIGHVLMLEFLRTSDRRYFDAGEAFNRINYDTNMVHTAQHLEGTKNWWPVKGCSHRHDVQPFGCPYVGMRGSYPVGHRILHLLTGDGVIADGLDIVAESSFLYAGGKSSRLGNSGESDGQGSAANALLWKYETSGDKKYLDACRIILDKTGLLPPKSAKDLAYGPSFGVFNAAGEYADLSGDKAFQDRVVAVAQMGAKEKEPEPFLYAMAIGYRFSKDEALKTQLEAILKKRAAAPKNGLEDLPPEQWPGHAGWRTPSLDPNTMRDLPYAMAILTSGELKAAEPRKPLTGSVPPKGWFKPGGEQTAQEKVPAAAELLGLAPAAAAPDDVIWVFPALPYLELVTANGKLEMLTAEKFDEPVSPVHNTIVGKAKSGPAAFTVRWQSAASDGVPCVRVAAACQLPKNSGRIASWGLQVPLKFSGKGNFIQTTAPGRFRLERCRLDQNDERIPNWLTSEYHWGEGAPLWPKWRESGIQIGPGNCYRIWRANRNDVSPVFCDQGEGSGNWLDITDRGASPRWGLTARILRPGASEPRASASGPLPDGRGSDTPSRQAIRVNLETGLMEIQFHDAAAEPLSEDAAAAGLVGTVDLIFHDGWRPPLAKPELTAAQYEKFMSDLNYGGNYGLFALRFALSISHQVQGKEWADKVRDLGIEPREILYGMLFSDGLAQHCRKLGVQWDANDLEGTVQRVVEHYRK